MNRKAVILIFIIILILVFLIVYNVSNKKTKNSDEESIISNIVIDEETGEYVLYNEITGDEIARSVNKSELYIYEIDPNYDPKMQATEEEEMITEYQ